MQTKQPMMRILIQTSVFSHFFFPFFLPFFFVLPPDPSHAKPRKLKNCVALWDIKYAFSIAALLSKSTLFFCGDTERDLALPFFFDVFFLEGLLLLPLGFDGALAEWSVLFLSGCAKEDKQLGRDSLPLGRGLLYLGNPGH